MALGRAGFWLALLGAGCALQSLDVEGMVEAAEALLEHAALYDAGWKSDRFKVAADGIQTEDVAAEGMTDELHGVYGEFPMYSMAQLLAHPAVGPILNFVDIGSGAGRLILGVAAMLGQEATVTGIEASPALHLVAENAVSSLVALGALRAGVVSTILADVITQPNTPTVMSAFAQADLVFCYSTAFPSEDGLRLPYLSAVLATFLRADCIVVTTDKWVVGNRFQFVDMVVLRGEDDEVIHAFIWRVVGVAIPGGVEAALLDVQEKKMGEDSCGENPEPCAALVEAIELQEAEYQVNPT